MKSILITGCNRGLGLGLVKCLVKDQIPPKNIIATCRSIDKAKELQEIASSNSNIHILQLDVQKSNTFEDFAKQVGDIVKEDGLNVLLNNAGYAPKSTRIHLVKEDQMMDTFAINTVGPLLLTKSLLPLLKKASETNCDLPLGSSKAAVINMSSFLGSISLNNNGGLYPYRCSKAALNMATKSLSIDLKKDGILAMCIHPGWVKTDMGGTNATLEIEASVEGMVNLMKNLSEEHNGAMYSWEGEKLEW